MSTGPPHGALSAGQVAPLFRENVAEAVGAAEEHRWREAQIDRAAAVSLSRSELEQRWLGKL